MLGRVEVDDFLLGVFEGEDGGVGWEDGEVGVEFLMLMLGMICRLRIADLRRGSGVPLLLRRWLRRRGGHHVWIMVVSCVFRDRGGLYLLEP